MSKDSFEVGNKVGFLQFHSFFQFEMNMNKKIVPYFTVDLKMEKTMHNYLKKKSTSIETSFREIDFTKKYDCSLNFFRNRPCCLIYYTMYFLRKSFTITTTTFN